MYIASMMEFRSNSWWLAGFPVDQIYTTLDHTPKIIVTFHHFPFEIAYLCILLWKKNAQLCAQLCATRRKYAQPGAISKSVRFGL